MLLILKHMFRSRVENAGQSQNIKTVNKCFEKIANLK
jgi:hypothetical protein